MPTSLYQTLTSERDALSREEQTIVAAAQAAGALTDENRERLTAIDERLTALGADIAPLERARSRTRTAPTAVVDDEVLEAAAEAASKRALATLPRPFASSAALGEQLVAVASMARRPGHVDQRLMDYQGAVVAAAQGLNERVDSEGGFLVQHDVSGELLQSAYETGNLVSRTRQREVSGSGLKIRAVDETSRADGSRMGGIQAYWTGEAEAFTASKPKFRIIDQDLDKLTGLYYATDELLEDATALQSEIEGWFRSEFGFKFDDAIVRGTGVGMPLGILNANALVSQAAEGGQTADTVNATNVQKMWARVRASDLGNTIWVLNQEVWPQLFAMNQANMPIFLPGGNLASAPFGALLGRPIVPSEQASAIGDVGDFNLWNLDQYLWIRKGGIAAATSIHVQFLTGETAFRFVVRANGQPIPNAAITPFKGASTLSPFVSLAAR
jgi:HK97 family phage major capsid protein